MTTYMVTGANGHLGCNLTKKLLEKGANTVATVRDAANCDLLKTAIGDRDCKIVSADLLNENSLNNSMAGVDILFHCAAVFKHWAKDPEEDIVQANIRITENVLRQASKCGVKRVIYVSSIVALDKNKQPMTPDTWNCDEINPYIKSKVLSEKRAWELAEELNIEMISVLPSAMLGGIYNHKNPTPSILLLQRVASGAMPFDIRFSINYIDVENVAEAMITAAAKGIIGNRYILGNDKHITTTQMFAILKELKPEMEIPPPISKEHLLLFANDAMIKSQETGNPPVILPFIIEQSYDTEVLLDTTLSQQELGFRPQKAEEIISSHFL
ncbi:MAG: NAD-dependent epimerase/dehydratase family protein [Gammaproteobacteria bacterium]|nr:MAG: NAD-dependent epimerase/dehydratase family protein [Gammaproteobacteria bacterium]